jgi:cyclophilin family peptidyl-prolyl cis-trans isomerase
MSSKLTKWIGSARRFFGQPAAARRRSANPLRHLVRLESRLTPSGVAANSTVATADINGDGFQDQIIGAGPGGAPIVRVFSGKNGQMIREFNAFGADFRGGVNVAAGDLNGDGRADIVVGAGAGGTPHVRAFDGVTGVVLADFLAYTRHFRGGVRVATANIAGSNAHEIITGAGPGGSAHVQGFDVNNLSTTGRPTTVLSFLGFDRGFTNGVYVATGDFGGDGQTNIIVGAGEGSLPVVRIFNPFQANDDRTGPAENNNFFAYDAAFRGGVRVATTNVTGGRGVDILTAAGPGGGPHVQVFDGVTLKSARSFYAFDPNFTGGVQLASNSEFDGGGTNEFFVSAGTGGKSVSAFTGETTTRLLVSYQPFDANITAPTIGDRTDVTPPVVTITSPIGSPTQSSNLTVTGTVTDDRSGVAAVEVSVDGGAFVNANLSNGTFSFTTSFPTDGSANGPHTLNFRGRDRSGNLSALVPVTFTLTSGTTAPTIGLAPESDTGTKGDLITANPIVSLIGTAAGGSSVELVGRGQTTRANDDGSFRFDSVSLEAGANTITVRATDATGSTNSTTVTITRNTGPTVSEPILNVTAQKNGSPTVLNLNENFSDVDVVGTRLRFSTSAGEVEVEMFDAQTPLTVANFLNYVDRGAYERSIFHRLVSGFVLQGGGFQFRRDNEATLPAIETDPPVPNEPGISNLRGTVAMAKLGNDPDSATSQFFFNLGDNSANLDNQNGGFTVFGRVVSGLDVIDALARIATSNQGGVFNEIPLQDYGGTSFPSDTRFANYAGLNSVTVTRRSDRLSYTIVANSNPNLVSTEVVGNRLTLTYGPGRTGTSTVTVRATDLDGSFVDQTFEVNVTG